MSDPQSPRLPQHRLSAWQVVWWFGFVSLAADMVYEGARSMYGPILAALGASGVVVGLVAGAGEAMALVLRLVFGPVADRTGRYWSLTIVGYAAIAWLLRYVSTKSYTPFVLYRIALGAVTLILLATGVLSA